MKKQSSIIGVLIVVVIGVVVTVTVLGKKDDSAKTATTPSTSSSTAPNTKTSTTPGIKNVNIVNFVFSQKEVSIKVGDTVTWTNADDANHTVTADDGMTGGLDSPILHKGETYSYVFNQAGVFKYHCKFHATMTGTITVVN